jgi:hypothetical protein
MTDTIILVTPVIDTLVSAIQGVPGAAGAAGAAGSVGAQGAAGAAGAQGIQGIQGAAGAQGVQGIQGIPGDSFNTVVTSIAVNTNAGAAANTRYVYMISGSSVLTLPTAVGNTNIYTAQNAGSATPEVHTTSSQTINGSAIVTLSIIGMSLDFISDGSNWTII